MHPVDRRAPKAALGIKRQAVEPLDLQCSEHLAWAERAVGVYGEAQHIEAAAVGNVEEPFVRGEGEAVGFVEATCGSREGAGARIIAVKILLGKFFQLFLTQCKKIVGISEPDRAVRADDAVVGAVESLALKPISEHLGAFSVGVPARELPRGLFDDIEAALSIGTE